MAERIVEKPNELSDFGSTLTHFSCSWTQASQDYTVIQVSIFGHLLRPVGGHIPQAIICLTSRTCSAAYILME
uniref:Uncharacterized protein n=1 Tax=Romanomermis culicivorax TaxID=13658 RepID=A0A915IQS2_ROMCU